MINNPANQQLEEDLKIGSALERLANSEDWKTAIINGYCTSNVLKNYTNLIHTDSNVRTEAEARLKAVAHFTEWVTLTFNTLSNARENI